MVGNDQMTGLTGLAQDVDDAGILGQVEVEVGLHPAVVGVGRHGVPHAARVQGRNPHHHLARAHAVLVDVLVEGAPIGGPGMVTVDGTVHRLAHGSCLYVGRGSQEVEFASTDADDLGPARFYLVSAPAHTAHPTTLVEAGKGTTRELGDPLTSNRRTLNQYIHENGVRSCQVVMGVTTLHPGSMWNTMPAHTHDRRMEAYLYFDLPEDARVIHILGEPSQTRHLVVANHEAVISPSWSVHSGVGTASYSFVWAMAGENQSFDDMDTFPIGQMR